MICEGRAPRAANARIVRTRSIHKKPGWRDKRSGMKPVPANESDREEANPSKWVECERALGIEGTHSGASANGWMAESRVDGLKPFFQSEWRSDPHRRPSENGFTTIFRLDAVGAPHGAVRDGGVPCFWRKINPSHVFTVAMPSRENAR